jgi:hypothetical protein
MYVPSLRASSFKSACVQGVLHCFLKRSCFKEKLLQREAASLLLSKAPSMQALLRLY